MGMGCTGSTVFRKPQGRHSDLGLRAGSPLPTIDSRWLSVCASGNRPDLRRDRAAQPHDRVRLCASANGTELGKDV